MSAERLAAAKRFKAFYGRAPKPSDIVDIGMKGEAVAAFRVGKLEGILYQALDNRTPYLHRFTKSRRPALYVSSDGKQFYALGGAYRFTSRGFVG